MTDIVSLVRILVILLLIALTVILVTRWLTVPLDVPDRDVLVFSTYAVILFTLLVQGFSLRWILRRLPSVAG